MCEVGQVNSECIGPFKALESSIVVVVRLRYSVGSMIATPLVHQPSLSILQSPILSRSQRIDVSILPLGRTRKCPAMTAYQGLSRQAPLHQSPSATARSLHVTQGLCKAWRAAF
mmetsp:Transcript_119409/g.283481  ORF Transcript_119409/g.283481 Transcript_119409/m.283481 type:complete len:114 (+) Transcript_119409:158-499(+)